MTPGLYFVQNKTDLTVQSQKPQSTNFIQESFFSNGLRSSRDGSWGKSTASLSSISSTHIKNPDVAGSTPTERWEAETTELVGN